MRLSLVFARQVSRLSLLQHIFLQRGCAIGDEPKYNSERQGGSGQGCDRTRSGLIEIEDDEPANQCEQSDQHYGAYLDDGAAMMPDDQQRVLEFESDQHRKHHAKETLKCLGISRVYRMGFDQA